jgi:MFS transporter, DHA1 family, multidrug resistance protein
MAIANYRLFRHGSIMHSPLPQKKAIGTRELVVMMASIMALNALAIDGMLPAFPAIGKAFSVPSDNGIQHVISSYLLGSGIGSLFFGPLSDRYGRRPILLGAMFGYGVFALACSFSSSFDMLLAMRFMHGFCGSALSVLVVSIIRDEFEGDEMAQRMSMIFLVFMIVPIIAPTIGQGVLLFAGWRTIFDLFAVMGIVVAIWVSVRLPETLHPEFTIPIQPQILMRTWGTVVMNRNAAGYMLGAAIVQGGLFGYLNSSQQIFGDVFNDAKNFALYFAIVAIGIACANFTNSKIVRRFGARRVSQTAVLIYITIGGLQYLAAKFVPGSLPLFLALLTANMAMVGFIGSNFSSIAMQPFGAVAGAASSFQTFTRTVIAALIGSVIGQQFNGTVAPMAAGFLLCGIVALVLVYWSESGKLFTRPGTTKQLPM